MSRGSIELPDRSPILVPARPEVDERYELYATSPAYIASGSEDVPSHEDLLSLHEQGLVDFLDLGRMGFVKERQYVAGFESHQFLEVPGVPHDDASQWQVARLELISLLKHETPMAYVSQHLPRMDDLKDAPTRRLDVFEQNALEQLWVAQDLVVEESAEGIRMVGSLRAGYDCLQCHLAERGDLLGAFSYTLQRIEPVQPAAKPAPVAPSSRAALH